KPCESVTNSQGLPTMTLTLGKDFKGAGVKLDATSVEKPELDNASTADQKLCAS
ncbi:LytR family transcriptional regulator, partial [Streptomyces sp. SID6013]|nr:LytR family transcriptional regulator [Streptomyces sp. SID6013]